MELRYPIQNAVLVVAVVLPCTRSTARRVRSVAIRRRRDWPAWLAAVVRGPIIRAPVGPVPIPDGAIRFGALHAAGAALTQVAHRGGVVRSRCSPAGRREAGYAALAIGLALGVTYAVLQAFTVSLPHLAGPDAAIGDADGRVLRPPGHHPAGRGCSRPRSWWRSGSTLVPTVFGDGYDEAVPAFGPALALIVLAPLGSLLVQAAALRLPADGVR